MVRPRLKPKTTIFEYLIEYLSIVLVLGLCIAPIYIYNGLPELIPTHYNLLGQPDAFNPRWSIFILPTLALLLFIGMSKLQKFPHIYNYPVEVNESNAEHLYSIGVRLIRFIKLIVILTFSYITYSSIRVATGHGKGLNIWILMIFILSIVLILIICIVKMYSKNN